MKKFDLYESITNRIIEELDKGIIPWHKPWTGIQGGAVSFSTKKPYSLINQMLLKKQGYYLTYKQAQELGGQVKKGAKSEMVIFWKQLLVKSKNESNVEEEKVIPFLKYYNVFHQSDIEGIDFPVIEIRIIDCEEKDSVAMDYMKRENIEYNEVTSNDAFYSPSRDLIQMPLRGQFENSEEFLSTLYHECVHSTGHESRLNRQFSTSKAASGKKEYSKEELVAEMGSAFMLAMLGVETKATQKNNTAYIQSWIQVLENDKKFVVSASGKAQKAIDYILNN